MASNLIVVAFETAPISKNQSYREITQMSWVVCSGNFPLCSSLRQGSYVECRVVDSRELMILPTHTHIDPHKYQQYWKAQPLQAALEYFDSYISINFVNNQQSYYIMVDGDFDIKYCLRKELGIKGTGLPEYFSKVFDIRNEFLRKCATKPESLMHMLKYLGIWKDCPTAIDCCLAISRIVEKLVYDGHVFSVPELISTYDPLDKQFTSCIRIENIPENALKSDILNLFTGYEVMSSNIIICAHPFDSSYKLAFVLLANVNEAISILDLNNMVIFNTKLNILPSHKIEMERYFYKDMKSTGIDIEYPLFNLDEKYKVGYQKKGYSDTHTKNARVSQDRYFIKVKNIPVSTKSDDLRSFFYGISIINTKISNDENGETYAFVEVASENDVNIALERQISPFGTKKLDISRVTKDGELLSHSERQKKESQLPIKLKPNAAPGTLVLLRGLPYSCTKDEIVSFFSGYKIVSDSIQIIYNDSRASGEAYAAFVNAEEASRALRERYHAYIGSRYIDLILVN